MHAASRTATRTIPPPVATVFDSAAYAASSEAAGSVLITRLTASGEPATALIQGEDAVQLAETLEALSLLPAERGEQLFNAICSEYSYQH